MPLSFRAMQRYRIVISSWLAVSLTLSACHSDEEETSNRGPYTPFNKIVISEQITPSDAQQVKWSQTFYYAEGQIEGSITEQRFAAESEEFVLEAHEKVAYFGNQVDITDDSGNKTSYYLDASGVASEAKRVATTGQIRTYEFEYQKQGTQKQLISVKEYIDGTLFSSLQMDYASHSGQLILWHQIGDRYKQELLIDLNKEAGFGAMVPPLFLSEIHPLVLHATALYGKLLGEAWPCIVRVTPAEGTSGIRYYTYQYNSQGFIESCTEAGAGSTRMMSYTFYP